MTTILRRLAAAFPAEALLFTVTRFDDQLDTLPGDGLCDTLGGGCALRAAIQEANSLFGPDSIYLPPGTYSLTRAGAGEDLAATGDLDVTSEIILLGTGWGVSSIFMANFNDRLFEVHGFSSLVLGIVNSPEFQMDRVTVDAPAKLTATTAQSGG